MLLVWGPRIENHWSRAVSHPWVHPGISKSFQRCSWPSLRSGLIGLRWGPDTGGFTQCPGDSNVQPQCRGALLLSSAALRLEPGLFTLQCQVRLLYKKNYSQPLNTLGVRGTGMPSWTLPVVENSCMTFNSPKLQSSLSILRRLVPEHPLPHTKMHRLKSLKQEGGAQGIPSAIHIPGFPAVDGKHRCDLQLIESVGSESRMLT